jgi:hypothetical protein
MLSPGEALARYGDFGSRGVLLVETRGAVVPVPIAGAADASAFEVPDPYPWTRVLTSTFVANALAVGLTYLPVSYCAHVWDGSFRRRDLREGQGLDPRHCYQAVAVGSGVLALTVPVPANALVARWSGTTSRSRGTLLSLSTGTLAHFTGHLLFFQGRATDSTVLTALGAAILTVGTPIAVTLTDWVSRTPR